MNVLVKRDAKEVEVRVSITIFRLLCSLTPRGIEDMFGADDEDWAIYRKIVCIIC